LLAASSASSSRRGGPPVPPSCRLDIIFDLEMVLQVSIGYFSQPDGKEKDFFG
jgi:hypothetical protein